MIFRGGDACGSAPQSAYAASTGGGEIREHLASFLSRLTLEARWFRLWLFAESFLVFSRASAFVLLRNAADGGDGPPFLSFSTGFSRASISVASRAIAPMMRPPSARSISRQSGNYLFYVKGIIAHYHLG
jgi:hypothetical protein